MDWNQAWEILGTGGIAGGIVAAVQHVAAGRRAAADADKTQAATAAQVVAHALESVGAMKQQLEAQRAAAEVAQSAAADQHAKLAADCAQRDEACKRTAEVQSNALIAQNDRIVALERAIQSGGVQ